MKIPRYLVRATLPTLCGVMLLGTLPSARAIDISSYFDRDTIVSGTSAGDIAVGTGYQFDTPPRPAQEWFNFVSNDYPDAGGDGVGDNLPSNGIVEVGDIRYQLGPYDGLNTRLLHRDAVAVTFDVPDGRYHDISVLSTGMFLPQNMANAIVRFNYARFPSVAAWDLADNAMLDLGWADLNSGGVVAIDGLDLIQTYPSGSSNYQNLNRILISQTFSVDPTKTLLSVTFDSSQAVFLNTQLGIYALEGTMIPEPASMTLVAIVLGAVAVRRTTTAGCN